MAISNDPFAAAVEAAERSGLLYGQMQVSASFIVLQKGVGKSAYIEGQHDPKDRRTEITLVLNPIEETGITTLFTRSVIAESQEWSQTVWPSLRDGCGQSQLRDLDNKFVKAELVKNGRKWTDKSGQEKEGTTFKFHAVYPDQAACVAAFYADGNTARTPNNNTTPSADPGAIDMTPSAQNPERETAKQFLIVLGKQAGGDKTVLEKLLGTMPLITKYFTVDSPEAAAALAG